MSEESEQLEDRREALNTYVWSTKMLIEAELVADDGFGCQDESLHLAGRTDVADYFEQSGIRSTAVLTHTPILAFVDMWICGPDGEEGTQVRIIEKPEDLLVLHDTVRCMAQWQGKRRSDFFQFTVGQFRAHLEQHPKKSYQRL